MTVRITAYILSGGDCGDDNADNDDQGGDDDAHDDDEDDEDDDDDMMLTPMRTTRMLPTTKTTTTMAMIGPNSLIDGAPHSLHFHFTARCNRRCLLIAIVTPV